MADNRSLNRHLSMIFYKRTEENRGRMSLLNIKAHGYFTMTVYLAEEYFGIGIAKGNKAIAKERDPPGVLFLLETLGTRGGKSFPIERPFTKLFSE